VGSIRQSEDYHIVIPKFYSEVECDSIVELISTHHTQLIEEFSPENIVWADSDGYTGLTALHSTYNWIPLIEDELGINLIERIMSFVDTRDCKDVFIKSWCNRWDKGEGIRPHIHAGLELNQIGEHDWEIDKSQQHIIPTVNQHMISGNIFLSHNDHREYGTWYQGKGWIENIRGDLHLFSPLIVHSVDSNTRQEARCSQAFDIHIDGHMSSTTLNPPSIYHEERALESFLHIEID